MPSFTSIYDATEEVDLGNGFHATIKKYLTDKDYREAGKALVKNRKYREQGNSATIEGDFDLPDYNHELVLRSLVSWNLTKDGATDKDNNVTEVPIPLADYKSGKYELPEPAFEAILTRVLELSLEARGSARADADFREPSQGSTTGE